MHRDLRRCAVPVVFHSERIASNIKQARVLPRVDSKSAQLLNFSNMLREFTVTATDKTLGLVPIDRDGCRKHPITYGPLPKKPASSTSL